MTQSQTKSAAGSKWGIGVAVLYGSFVVLMLAFVVLASMQSFDLVEDDYYERGLVHQERIDQGLRAASLTSAVTAAFDPDRAEVVLSYPTECSHDTLSSQVWLYRPSNAQWDKHYPDQAVVLSEQRLAVDHRVPGLWRARIEWQWRGESYYSEAEFLLDQ